MLIPPRIGFVARFQGVCLSVSATGDWALSGTTPALSGKLSKDVTKQWTRLGIDAKGKTVTVSVDGKPQPGQASHSGAGGMVSVNSGYNVAYYDNFALKAP